MKKSGGWFGGNTLPVIAIVVAVIVCGYVTGIHFGLLT